LHPPSVPKEKGGMWTGLREMRPNFSFQHPNSNLVAADSVTKGNSLKLQLGRFNLDIIFIRTM